MLSAAQAEALLYENAARVRDEFIRDVRHCEVAYAYAGWPGERKTGWTAENYMRMRGERLSSWRSSNWPGPTHVAADRIHGFGSGDYDPAEWFGAEHRRFVEGEPRGTYVGQFTYLRQPSLRYETRTEHTSSAGTAVATILSIDYLVEDPYVFIENEFSVFEDGTQASRRMMIEES